jgi:hypothetical protein
MTTGHTTRVFFVRPLACVLLAAVLCRGEADVQIEVRNATVTDHGLAIVLDSFTPVQNLMSGFRLKDRRQVLVRYRLPREGGDIWPTERVQLPPPPKDDSSENEFVVAPSGGQLIRVREISTRVIEERGVCGGGG